MVASMWPYISLSAVLVATYVLYYRVLHPLSRVPGPFFASLSRLWLVRYTQKHQRHRDDRKLHEKYGPVVRIAPDEIIFSNADHFKTVYGAGSQYKKGRWYESAVDPAAGNVDTLNMLPETNLERLRMQKRLVGPTYSIANVKSHEDLVDSTLNVFRSKMDENTGKPLDFYWWLELLCIDMFTELTYWNRMGVLEAESDKGHLANMDNFWRLISWLGLVPALNKIMLKLLPFLSIVFNMGADMPVFSYCHGQMKVIEESEKESIPKLCIFSDLLRLSKARPEFKFNYAQMMSLTNLGAGVDTTTWTLATFLGSTMLCPRVRRRLISEIDAAAKSYNLERNEPFSYDQAAGLPYLQACLFETQRLYPNIGTSLQRVVPSSGITIDDFYIPAGTAIGMNSYVLAHNKSVFGEDADKFRPERWLEASREQKHDMENRNLAFGGPSRKCPGMHLAWVCMTKFLPTLLKEFDVEVLNSLNGPPGPGGRQWVEASYFVTKWSGWEVKLSRRT